MEGLVFRNGKGNDVTTSLLIAETFGKAHKNVLADIRSLGCSKGFHGLNFQLSFIIRELQNGGSKKEEYYEITKDGFSFLALGYTGAKADKFKEDYIQEFNRRGQLNNQVFQLPNYAQALRELADTVDKNEVLQKQLKEAEPAIDFYNAVTDSSDAIDMGMAAKVLNIIGIGRNELFKRLRIKGILMSNNMPYQEFIDKGYFRVIESKYNKPDGSVHVNFKTVVYQKGLDFIRRKISEDNSLAA